MCDIFDENNEYELDAVVNIARANKMTTIDCLKDENSIWLEGFDGQELSGEAVFEFSRLPNEKFILVWFEPKWRNTL